jgi:hypothetical protein
MLTASTTVRRIRQYDMRITVADANALAACKEARLLP